VNLTLPILVLPLLTLLGLADNPGEAAGWGALDPGLVRGLAASAARAGDQSEWHLTLTDSRGWAVGHGCATRTPSRKPKKTDAKGDAADAAEWEDRTWTVDLPGGAQKAFTMLPIPVQGE
jgi:hypothetical protein